MTIYTSDLMNTIITEGMTYSPEAGDPYPMRSVPLDSLVNVIAKFLIDHGVQVNHG